jgi:hypothetical protein
MNVRIFFHLVYMKCFVVQVVSSLTVFTIRSPITAENSGLFYVSWSKSIRIVGQQMAVPWHLLDKLRGKSKRTQIENQMII